MIRTAILYRRHWLVAKNWTRDVLVGLAFGAAVITTMFVIGNLPAIYTWLTGAQ